MQPRLDEAIAAFQNGQLDRARELARQELEAGATSAQVQHLMGLIDCRLGRLESGVEWLRRAVDEQPQNVAFRVMLVRALVDSGRAREALDAAIAPSGSSTSELPLLLARAEAAAAAENHIEAAEAWRMVCSQQPGDSRGWINLGRSLLALGEFARAERAYRTALAIAPAAEEGLYELGLIYERTGQFQALGKLLDGALETGLGKERLAYLWAARERQEGRLQSAREILLKSAAGRDPVRWQRLRTRIADEMGDAAEAWDAAVAMNRASPDYDAWLDRAAKFRAELRQLASTITPPWAAGLPSLDADERRSPVFLVGFPRSGTTLLDTFLLGHPRVAVVEEKGVLPGAIGPTAGLAECPAERLERARDIYFDALARHVDPAFDGIVVEKAPLNMLAAPAIHVLFPNTSIIFAQRHPCDAVLSGFMQGFAANLGMANFLDIADAADFYDAAMRAWTASCAALALRVRNVVYEQLVETPESVLEPLVRWLGLEWDARMLDHRATAGARGPVMNTSHDQITQPLSTGAIGRWRRYEQQLAPVLPVLLPWAEQLGYRD